jgi:hypothetical protein
MSSSGIDTDYHVVITNLPHSILARGRNKIPLSGDFVERKGLT